MSMTPQQIIEALIARDCAVTTNRRGKLIVDAPHGAVTGELAAEVVAAESALILIVEGRRPETPRPAREPFDPAEFGRIYADIVERLPVERATSPAWETFVDYMVVAEDTRDLAALRVVAADFDAWLNAGAPETKGPGAAPVRRWEPEPRKATKGAFQSLDPAPIIEGEDHRACRRRALSLATARPGLKPGDFITELDRQPTALHLANRDRAIEIICWAWDRRHDFSHIAAFERVALRRAGRMPMPQPGSAEDRHRWLAGPDAVKEKP